ncbi:sensor histidine kinase [Terribacillus sp. DMT04]|uniref:sensor histidine kinase n=1 Tax=Terribacillus sp. DMT04 TaxID=2850441 RepID=UPI001C2C0B95|nr:sensor histidine kinase [Terribacillus sp. DMT04]QXE00368.1 histidine kinase [Terribacillus sp. DMT04]
MNFKQIFRHLPLMQKLLFSYTLLTIIPVSLLGFFIYAAYMNAAEEQIGALVPQMLEQASQQIDRNVQDVTIMPERLYQSQQTIEILRADAFQSHAESMQQQYEMERYLSNSFLHSSTSDLLGVFVFSKNRIFAATTEDYRGFSKTEAAVYGQSLELEKGSILLLPHETNLVFNNGADYLLIGVPLQDRDNQTYLGTMFLALDVSFVDRITASMKDHRAARIMLVDKMSGRLAYDSSGRDNESVDLNAYPIENGSFLQDGKLIGITPAIQQTYALVYEVPTEILFAKQQHTRTISIVLFLVFICFSLFFYSLAAYNVSQPIKQLMQNMRSVQQGEFQRILPVTKQDEVGRLTESYNIMIEEIRDLIQKNYMIKLKQQEAELYALQTQINPHFIFNTLETINYAVEAGEQEEVMRIITTLGRMLRYSLDNGVKFVSLAEEIGHVKDFLSIQQFRFFDRLTWSTDYPNEAGSLQVPKFILQPIVENSIKYGLEVQTSIHIGIKIQQIEGLLVLTIKDDGPGFDPVVREKLEKELALEPGITSKSAHYGLSNVANRIKMLYGADYGISLENNRHGATVLLYLPFQQV